MRELYNTLVQAQGTLTLNGASAVYSDTFSMSKATHTAFALSWENLTSFNARAILQCSVDGTNWNDMGGDTEGIILDTEDGGQVWLIEFTKIPYLRLELTRNNLTSGTVTWEIRNYGA
jgi:hypothetical protein